MPFNFPQAIPVIVTDGVNAVAATATAKGTQGATATPTQDLKDAGRSSRSIFLDSYQTVQATEILNTLSFSADGAAVTTGTSYSVTAAKRLRLQSILATLMTTAGNTTPVTVIVRIRVNAGGAAIITSPIQFVFALPGVAAVNNAADPVKIVLPDGFELPAGAGLGITTTCPGWVVTTAAPLVNLSLTAFEY